MSVEISSAALQQILARAAASEEREVCGLLFGDAGRIDAVEHCANVAANPATTFETDPARLIAAHRAARAGGPAIIGHYHSHPRGPAMPSPRDAVAAAPDGTLWLIVAGGEARLWRAVGNGAVEGRFEPLELRTDARGLRR